MADRLNVCGWHKTVGWCPPLDSLCYQRKASSLIFWGLAHKLQGWISETALPSWQRKITCLPLITSLTSWIACLGLSRQRHYDCLAQRSRCLQYFEFRVLFPFPIVLEHPAISRQRTLQLFRCLCLEGLNSFLMNGVTNIPVSSIPRIRILPLTIMTVMHSTILKSHL